jgi:hypothetical protein
MNGMNMKHWWNDADSGWKPKWTDLHPNLGLYSGRLIALVMKEPHSEEGTHRTAMTLNHNRTDGLLFSALTKVYFVGSGCKKFTLDLSSVKLWNGKPHLFYFQTNMSTLHSYVTVYLCFLIS